MEFNFLIGLVIQGSWVRITGSAKYSQITKFSHYIFYNFNSASNSSLLNCFSQTAVITALA